jgi:hypothetical protein
MYSDTDWHSPSPYPYGHANQPKYPPAKMLAAQHDEEVDDQLTGNEFRIARSETRRRRWLRRAIFVGKQ